MGTARSWSDVRPVDSAHPSGTLVVIDGGHLGTWSGEMSPAEIDPALLGVEDAETAADVLASVDFAVVGPDASEAARSFGRQPGAVFHDVPASRAAGLGTMFEDHCRAWMRQIRASELETGTLDIGDARLLCTMTNLRRRTLPRLRRTGPVGAPRPSG